MNRKGLGNLAILTAISLAVASITYAFNLWFFASHPNINPTDAAFLEGLFFIFTGIIVLIGSGGISRTSQKAALLASAAKAMSNDVIGPSEVFRRDAWKPKGYVRLGLVLIMTGVFLLFMYFASVYVR